MVEREAVKWGESIVTEFEEETGEKMAYNLGAVAGSCIVQCAPNRDLIYVIGGTSMNEGTPSDRCLEININEASDRFNVVVKRAPVPKPISGHSAICIRNWILVAGVESFGFDLTTKEWSNFPKLPMASESPTLVSVANRFVYSFGLD